MPYKGWAFIDIEDPGKPSVTCEMCETQEICYIHHRQHPHHSNVLGCGCVGASHMEEDYEGATAGHGSVNAE